MTRCIKDLIQNMNLVIGCDIGCSYCYARNNCRRFHITEDFSRAEFYPGKLRLMEKSIPHNWFLTGMSDLSVWEEEWKKQVFKKMEENPQHQFIFLSKRPEKCTFDCKLDNAWFGVTVTSSKEKERISLLKSHIKGRHYHVTFEPLFDDIGPVDLTGIDWIVIGTETGKRKGKAVSKVEWVQSLTRQAHERNIPVFMKEDLLPIMGEGNMIQELPEEFNKVLEAQNDIR